VCGIALPVIRRAWHPSEGGRLYSLSRIPQEFAMAVQIVSCNRDGVGWGGGGEWGGGGVRGL
jgi:hypothetical protein